MGFFIETSYAETNTLSDVAENIQASHDEVNAKASALGSLAFPMIILAIFYFLMIRPQQKKAKEHRTLIAAVKQGDEVFTNAGIVGVVESLKDDYINLKVSDDTHIMLQKSCIAGTLPAGTVNSIK